VRRHPGAADHHGSAELSPAELGFRGVMTP
jgi:hypothetical protein